MSTFATANHKTALSVYMYSTRANYLNYPNNKILFTCLGGRVQCLRLWKQTEVKVFLVFMSQVLNILLFNRFCFCKKLYCYVRTA